VAKRAQRRDDSPSTRRKPRRIEEGLQQLLVDYWRAAVAPGPDAPLLWAVPNGEARDQVTAAKLVGISAERRAYLSDDEALLPFGLGVVPGVVDLVIMSKGPCTTLVELKPAADKERKIKAGTMNRQQRLFRARAIRLGFNHVVVHSLDEFATVLSGLGIRLRVRWWGPGVAPPPAALPAAGAGPGA
jgi:hypothetical protein